MYVKQKKKKIKNNKIKKKIKKNKKNFTIKNNFIKYIF